MKLRLFSAALCASLVLSGPASAQDAVPSAPGVPPNRTISDPVMAELKVVVDLVTAKIKNGPVTAESLAPEFAQFDALLAKHAGEKTESVAKIALMRAVVYLEILHDNAKGRESLVAVKNDFPGTRVAANVEQVLAQLDHADQASAAKKALIGKPAPELHFNWSSRPELKTLSSLKGQVVILDFWATWCGPCIASFPQIREHVARFKGAPVTFLGVTSIQGYVANMGARIDTKGDPAKEMALMPDFMKAKEMTWDVAFSEERVFNPDYGILGIPYVAIIAPDGTVRHAGLHPGDPASDIAGKIEALLKEFKLPLPAPKA